MNEIDELNDKIKPCEESQTNTLSINQRLNEIENILKEDNGLMQFNSGIFKSLINEVIIDKKHLTFIFSVYKVKARNLN